MQEHDHVWSSTSARRTYVQLKLFQANAHQPLANLEHPVGPFPQLS
jgi:hypothetical protein